MVAFRIIKSKSTVENDFLFVFYFSCEAGLI